MVGLSIINIIAISCIVIGGIMKAFMDLSSEGNLPWKPKWFFDKSVSWKAKWKLDKQHNLIPATKGDNWWYFGIIKPKYKEKFPLSSTLLVFISDFWHLSQGFFLKFILVGVYIHEPMFGQLWYHQLFEFWLLYILMLVPFELTYSYMKKKSSLELA
jgi:hypothetical protein